MPIYFNDVAPFCPISRDQPAGPLSPTIINRFTIPNAFDLKTAIAAANAARLILSQLVLNRIVNNMFTPTPSTASSAAANALKNRTSKWVEQKSKRVTRKYKYFGDDNDTWVLTERIEHMVWADAGWRTYLVWDYGDKGEGEPQ